MAGRGELTDTIKKMSKQLLGYEITQSELRLMPYVQYVMMNEQKLDPRSINQEEREILRKWKDKGFIEGGASGLSISYEFYNIICQLLWLGYVAYEES